MSFRPTKPRAYDDTQGVVSRGFDELGVKTAAFELGLKLSRTYELADPDKGKAQMSYEQARRLTLAGATAFADDLAALAGGRCGAARTCGKARQESFGEAMAREERDHGSATALLMRHADSAERLSAGERDELKRRLDAVIADLTLARRKLSETRDAEASGDAA